MNVRDAILKGTTEAEQLDLIYKLFGTPTGSDEKYSSTFHRIKWKGRENRKIKQKNDINLV